MNVMGIFLLLIFTRHKLAFVNLGKGLLFPFNSALCEKISLNWFIAKYNYGEQNDLFKLECHF